jgi:hypothetical protein
MKYSTKTSCEGEVYSDIADVMTAMGHPMNHCTARNVVLGVMEKMVTKIAKKNDIKLSSNQVKQVAMSSQFQSAVTTVLDLIESE